jgi:hypothetical protein
MATSIVTTDSIELTRTRSPNLPIAPKEYSGTYQDQLNKILRLYFNQLDNLIGQLMANTVTLPISIGGTNTDAFGRLRVSEPYTLFDSQNRYAKDNQFSETTANGASITYDSNASTVLLSADTTSGSKAVRQSLRVMPYQPGKGLLFLGTFVMAAAQTNLRQRVGYFNTSNGVFFQKSGSTNSFILRTSTSGSPSDARTVDQASWNGDKLDGTGTSGLTLDTTKAQILWMDFEWLGVGSVRCGFIINGEYIVCHTFNNANDLDKVYMTTAILPVRYEIEALATLTTGATIKQVCSTVISEGGYAQVSAPNIVRRTTTIATTTTFKPIASIRLKSTTLGAVVLPQLPSVFPTSAGDYEVALIRLPDDSYLTGESWTTTPFQNVEYDTSATAMTYPDETAIIQNGYLSASNQSAGAAASVVAYNFDTQIGVTLANVSQIYTVAVRNISGTGNAIGSISFIDLTQ